MPGITPFALIDRQYLLKNHTRFVDLSRYKKIFQMAPTEKTQNKNYPLLLLLFVVVCAIGWGGYRYYRKRQENHAITALNKLDKKAKGYGDTEDEKRNLAREYKQLFEEHKGTKAAQTACYIAGKFYYEMKDYNQVIEALTKCPLL